MILTFELAAIDTVPPDSSAATVVAEGVASSTFALVGPCARPEISPVLVLPIFAEVPVRGNAPGVYRHADARVGIEGERLAGF